MCCLAVVSARRISSSLNNLHWLDENEQVREYLYQFGLEKDETITGGLAVGYAFNGLPERTPLERKGNPVTWVE